jgi:hypothetical protein
MGSHQRFNHTHQRHPRAADKRSRRPAQSH